MKSADEFNVDELYKLAQYGEIKGRSDLNKTDLYRKIKSEKPQLLEPFGVVFNENIEEGENVEMNHLKSTLEVQKFITDEDKYYTVVMETKRGGRHALIVPRGKNKVGKNGNEPHLKRWRAGDSEWMNNSTDPVYIFKVSEE